MSVSGYCSIDLIISMLQLYYLYARALLPTPVLLPGKSHGRRSLVSCSPWCREESDMTERLHFHFLLSCIREGNGNLLQCSCLENSRDGGAWWAAVCGVTQSLTWLKRLSSSSSSTVYLSIWELWRKVTITLVLPISSLISFGISDKYCVSHGSLICIWDDTITYLI